MIYKVTLMASSASASVPPIVLCAALQIQNKCLTCPAHNTVFDIETGAVQGEWA